MAGKSGLRVPKFYPMAKLIDQPMKRVQGEFEGGPKGVTVHYSASRNVQSTIDSLDAQNLGYHLIIDREGKITQTASMGHRVNHAGKAAWNGYSPNRSHIAVCMISYGYLEPGFKAWSGQVLPEDETAYRQGYYWDKCTEAQENTLWDLLRWFLAHGIDPANICGHDECCIPKGRKVDPGGCLSQTMGEIRAVLQSGPTLPAA